MDSKAGTLLVPPNVKNVSCSHPRYTGSLIYYVGPFDAIQALLILMLTVGIIGANLLVIFVINHRRYSPYIHPQPRYLLTSLSLNDLAIGLLITPFGVLPALFHCWPYGEIYCQIQALLRGALSQQSAVILVCMAVDRYMCALHPDKYEQHSSKKGCVAILSVTWTLCLTMFGLLVLPKGYYFNNTGLLVCEPFYSKPSHRILATCSLYFPTTMILMYCYGSSFHASSFRLVATPPAVTTPSSTSEKVVSLERRLNGSASRTMAAMSLGYIVMVTPWAIQEIVAACTNSKVPPFLDFFVTWTAISNSFWNPFIYWLLNAHFRRLGKEIFINKCFAPDEELPTSKSRCCSVSSECDPNTLPMPPGPPSSKPPRQDLEGLSEKYWGEILERTVSSNSLHALQRVYGYKTHTNSHLEMNGLTSPDNSSSRGNVLSNFSNSEPRLCEHYHDINCAKTKAFLNGQQSIQGITEIGWRRGND